VAPEHHECKSLCDGIYYEELASSLSEKRSLDAMQEAAPTEIWRWLAPARKGRVMLLGDGDLSFAVAFAEAHEHHFHSGGTLLDATVFLDSKQWHERFEDSNDAERVALLEERSHRVRFGVDATTETCSGCSAVYFNFPNVSVTEATDAEQEGLTPSGALASAFLENARRSADPGTLLVLGLWGRCDGGVDPRLYGLDAHALVAAKIAASKELEGGNTFEDALEIGYEREGARADYSYYHTYEQYGYTFRTNWESGFAHKEWHLKGCFVLRVVARQDK
jgi:hypothetical protein